MPPQMPSPLNFATFWSILGKVVVGIMNQHGHGEIVIVLHEGNIPVVRVNRTYRPDALPGALPSTPPSRPI